MAGAPFSPKALSFLRALARNNRREWFHAHREQYELHLRTPITAVIERLGEEFRHFAPEQMADPKRSLYRIWRDTRFSPDKRPLKTNVAAVFPHRDGDRHTSAGFYLEIAPKWVFAGGGLYRPERPALVRIRERIASDPRAFRRVSESPGMKKMGGLKGEQLARVPRGYPADHPAAEYLRFKQFVAFREWPPELATSPRFWPELLSTLRAVAPLVAYLNTTLHARGVAAPLIPRAPRV